jgi:glucose-1-phosphate cytidylyltransferase
MKIVILAGGLGTRISEESHLKPKPMIEIGNRPIIWHIMKIFEAQGYNDFIICLGYKGYVIKEYFLNYYMYNSDVTVDLEKNCYDVHTSTSEKFKVTMVDTGLHTLTAGRLRRIRPYVGEEDFILTYGDGLADINVEDLLSFHKRHECLATVTAVQPAGRFGSLGVKGDNMVQAFHEKLPGDGGWVNGGFFVLKNGVFDYLPENSDQLMWEQSPIEGLVRDGQLAAYKHGGFWKCLDVARDKEELEKLWQSGKADWKIW